MKAILALLFGLSVVLNAPTVCAHALSGGMASVETAKTADHAPMQHDAPAGHMAHHEMADIHDMGASHDMDHDQPGDDHQHNHCDDDCTGGAGCETCTVISASVDITALTDTTPQPDRGPFGHLTSLNGQSSLLDPPPPRA